MRRTKNLISTRVRITLALLLVSFVACAPPAETCFGDDGDLAVLTQMRQVIDDEYYDGTFPETPIAWANGPTEYYAFVPGTQHVICFVTPNFRHDWEHNARTMRHEMAHVAVGPGHGHDAMWAREFRRLQRSAVPIEFAEIRATARAWTVARR
jgi:hypothetical protein